MSSVWSRHYDSLWVVASAWAVLPMCCRVCHVQHATDTFTYPSQTLRCVNHSREGSCVSMYYDDLAGSLRRWEKHLDLLCAPNLTHLCLSQCSFVLIFYYVSVTFLTCIILFFERHWHTNVRNTELSSDLHDLYKRGLYWHTHSVMLDCGSGPHTGRTRLRNGWRPQDKLHVLWGNIEQSIPIIKNLTDSLTKMHWQKRPELDLNNAF